MRHVLGVLRDESFSPNSAEKDRAIILSVLGLLRERGCQVETVSEGNLDTVRPTTADIIFTMGRRPATLSWLKRQKATVINRPEGVERCVRSTLARLMDDTQVPIPPANGTDGYWLKRGDAAAQTAGDVVYAANKTELAALIEGFHQRGIGDYTVSAHVAGDVVKFYGVLGTGFFRYYYPTDDGQTKFGDEQRNGPAHHYPFDAASLEQVAARLASRVGIQVYGGDCIVGADGRFCLIDFNDWPSFSRCRQEAAVAIASLILDQNNVKKQRKENI